MRDIRLIEKRGPTMTAEMQMAGLQAVLADEGSFSRWYERSAHRVYAYVFNRCGGSAGLPRS